MRRFTEEYVMQRLHALVSIKSMRKAGAQLGFDAGFICNVLKGNKPLSEDLALALGFEKLPDAYISKRRDGARGK
jgi:hypothetical protein